MEILEGRTGANVPPAFEDEYGFAFRPEDRAPFVSDLILGFLAGVTFTLVFEIVIWYLE